MPILMIATDIAELFFRVIFTPMAVVGLPLVLFAMFKMIIAPIEQPAPETSRPVIVQKTSVKRPAAPNPRHLTLVKTGSVHHNRAA